MSKGKDADSCKICGCGRLNKYAHTARCDSCGVLLFWPYPKPEAETGIHAKQDNWNREFALEWYSKSSFYNHANFTNMVHFAMDESYKGRTINILDYGAGGGQFTLVCKSLFPQAMVFTTDISEESLLTEWKSLSNPIPFRLFSKDETKFDVIFLNDVFEHLSDPIDVLTQLRGKLNGNGVIFIDTPKQFWLYPVTWRLSKSIYTKLLRATVHEAHLQIWTKRSFMVAVEKSGLKVSKYFETSEFSMPPDFYLDNMQVNNSLVRFMGKAFYRFATLLASNKIMALLDSDQSNPPLSHH